MKQNVKSGFTLIELLLVLAIITVLNSIVVYLLKQEDIFGDTNNVKRNSDIISIEKALTSYKLNNSGKYPASFNSFPSGQYDICKSGETDCTGTSINIDELVSASLLSEVPVDPDCESQNDTCYNLKIDKENITYSIGSDLVAGSAPGASATPTPTPIDFDLYYSVATISPRLVGTNYNDGFGAFTVLGDFNGDGIQDMGGASLSGEDTGSDRGIAYIFLGDGSGLNSAEYASGADVSIFGVADDDWLGYSMSGVGDVNNDGFDDLLIGAINAGSGDRGRAYLFLGNASPSVAINAENADLIITGDADNNNFGFSVAALGDINNDGYHDYAVGAQKGSSDKGRVYIFLGENIVSPATAVAGNADVIITGQNGGDYFGWDVDLVEDYNNDGKKDLIVGAPNAGTKGKAYVFSNIENFTYPSSILATTANVIISGEQDYDSLGTSVDDAGDINNDGYSDFVIGANQYQWAGTNGGKVYIKLGSAGLVGAVNASASDLIITSEGLSDQLGEFVGGLGDVNKDGYDDIGFGAVNADNQSGIPTGRSYVLFGGSSIATGTQSASASDVIFDGIDSKGQLGIYIDAGIDLNLDGKNEIFITAFRANGVPGGLYNGAIYIYYP